MKNPRTYGKPPYTIAVLHGGPGAAGEMAPVAEALSSVGGVLEPFQTADSIDGQVEELRDLLDRFGELPVTLCGFSWGAWLAFIFSARFPRHVKKLILLSSGSFEEKYAEGIMATRLSRLPEGERKELIALMERLDDPAATDKDSALAGMGRMIARSDAYRPVSGAESGLEVDYDIYRNVWREADELRRSGRLLDLGRRIRCPVVAIHGDYDPHSSDGVRIPLSRVLSDFRFVLLNKCGHRPWLEREAKDDFYEVLKKEWKSSDGSRY